MTRILVPAALLILFGAPAMAQVSGEGLFERADTNHDGSVTREEFVAARAEQFRKLDRNSDGYIDSQDVPKRLAARRQRQGGGDLLVGQFDADGDGKVSQGEFVNGPTLMFDRADRDKNNVLDPTELAEARAAAKEAGEKLRKRRQ